MVNPNSCKSVVRLKSVACGNFIYSVCFCYLEKRRNVPSLHLVQVSQAPGSYHLCSRTVHPSVRPRHNLLSEWLSLFNFRKFILVVNELLSSSRTDGCWYRGGVIPLLKHNLFELTKVELLLLLIRIQGRTHVRLKIERLKVED